MFFWILLLFILGSAIGSFLNVVIDRSLKKESILGRSYCDHCRATLGVFDLVPIISFLALSAKCRFCKKPISLQYPLVEALTGVLFVLTFLKLLSLGDFNFVTLFVYLFLMSVFVVVGAVDLKFTLIPTSLVFGASLIFLFYNFLSFTPNIFLVHVMTAFGLALAFGAIVVVTCGRGMGTGDVPLVFLIGMVLGWPQSFVSVFLAFAIGALVSVVLLVKGRKKLGQAIAFGPFLVLGAILSLFWGGEIMNWYISIL